MLRVNKGKNKLGIVLKTIKDVRKWAKEGSSCWGGVLFSIANYLKIYKIFSFWSPPFFFLFDFK